VRNALRGPKRLCVLRSVKRKKNVQGGGQDKVGCTTMVSTVVLGEQVVESLASVREKTIMGCTLFTLLCIMYFFFWKFFIIDMN
jgi:hypothetical protein